MTIPEDLRRLPEGLASTGDPIEHNPFEPHDARYEVWNDATRAAEIEVSEFEARMLQEVPAPAEAFNQWLVKLLAGRFDVWAKRYVHVVWSDEMIDAFDKWLISFADASIEQVVAQAHGPGVFKETAVVHLRAELGISVKRWKAEARQYRVEQRQSEQQQDTERAQHRHESSPTGNRPIASSTALPTVPILNDPSATDSGTVGRESATNQPPASRAAGKAGGDPQSDAQISEVTRRQRLLADYKSSTGNPSNKRIYQARNSGIHKPQFLAWLRGELSPDSITTRHFEKFLGQQKAPIPRKPHS